MRRPPNATGLLRHYTPTVTDEMRRRFQRAGPVERAPDAGAVPDAGALAATLVALATACRDGLTDPGEGPPTERPPQVNPTTALSLDSRMARDRP